MFCRVSAHPTLDLLETSRSVALSRISTLHCTCCYDEINGIQDLEMYSHADSLSRTPYHLYLLL